MSRNASGTMSALNGPYAVNTVIDQSLVNARIADVESELSDSLSRSGKGGMTSPVRGADGSISAPTYSFTSDTDTGIYRAGSADVRLSIDGTDQIKVTASSVVLTSKATLASGSTPVSITPNTNITAGSGLAYWKDAVGNVHIKGTVTNATGGAINNLVTTNALPAGFRPSFTRVFICGNNSSGLYNISVDTSGNIACQGGRNGLGDVTALSIGATVYLDGINFLSEA